jgi:hypothetical protein
MVINAPLTPPKYSPKSLQLLPVTSRAISMAITPIINWPHCGDHEVARLRRSWNGSIEILIAWSFVIELKDISL